MQQVSFYSKFGGEKTKTILTQLTFYIKNNATILSLLAKNL